MISSHIFPAYEHLSMSGFNFIHVDKRDGKVGLLDFNHPMTFYKYFFYVTEAINVNLLDISYQFCSISSAKSLKGLPALPDLLEAGYKWLITGWN